MFKNIFKKKQAIHAQAVVDLRDYTPQALSNIKVIEAVALLILPENPSNEFIEAFSKIKLDAVGFKLNLPSDKKIEHGDFITMDYGAVVEGYHSDMTRTVAVGEVSSKQEEVYETVLAAQKKSLEILKAGISCKDADDAARNIIKNAGYGDYFGHGTGHGVGIEIHEEPRVSPKSGSILQAGDIVTVEPGIYLPSEFGVRIEDMAFITDNGSENLTKSPKNLIIL